MDLLINNLREDAEAKKPVNMVAYLNFLTFDLIGDLAFASPFDALKDRKEHPWMATFFKSIIEGTVLGNLLGFPFLVPFIALFANSLRKSFNKQIEYTREKVKERIAGGTQRPDFMAQVLKNNDFSDTSKGMTRAEIDVTFNLLMIAGSETTATLLSGCMYLLAKNKRITKELKEEVRRAFSNADEITVVTVCQLHSF
jgi:cytochrome P450